MFILGTAAIRERVGVVAFRVEPGVLADCGRFPGEEHKSPATDRDKCQVLVPGTEGPVLRVGIDFEVHKGEF